jgi:ribose transport system ATP-binding protein
MSVRDNVTMASWQRFTCPGDVDEGQKALRKTAKEYVDQLKVKTPSIRKPVSSLAATSRRWSSPNGCCATATSSSSTNRRAASTSAPRRNLQAAQGLAAQGKAIVVISSELPEILRLSHRIIVMCEGRITGELDGKTATQESIMTLAAQGWGKAA